MGLNKPIIITSSAVDTSNLATKSDMTTLQNSVTSALANVGGMKIKSFQKVSVEQSTTTITKQSNAWYGVYYYQDFTISAVNTAKTFVITNSNDQTEFVKPIAEVISSGTALRITYGEYQSTGSKYYSASGVYYIIELE